LSLLEDRDPALLLSPFFAMMNTSYASSRRALTTASPEKPGCPKPSASEGSTAIVLAARRRTGRRGDLARGVGAESLAGDARALATWAEGATVVCWGRYVPEQLAAHGAETLDLKPHLRDFLKRKLGPRRTSLHALAWLCPLKQRAPPTFGGGLGAMGLRTDENPSPIHEGSVWGPLRRGKADQRNHRCCG